MHNFKDEFIIDLDNRTMMLYHEKKEAERSALVKI